MKISYHFVNARTIYPDRGDTATEYGIISALCKFADVYFAGQKCDPTVKGLGLRNYPGPIIIPKDCDIYYVRANRDVFLNLPKNKIKIWMASPVDYDCYSHADVLATFSDSWTAGIHRAAPWGWVPPNCRKSWKAITINQVLRDDFCPQRLSKKSREIRKSIGGNFIIGHFGRLAHTCYPYALLKIWNLLKKKYPGIRFLVASHNNNIPLLNGITLTKYDPYMVPFAISACDLVLLSNWGEEWDICGSLKAMEAAACGVPLLLGRSSAREEFLGSDYEYWMPSLRGNDPNFLDEDAYILKQMIESCIEDTTTWMRVASSMPGTVAKYREAPSAVDLQRKFERLLHEKSL